MSTRRQNDTYTATVIAPNGATAQARADHGYVYLEIRQAGSRYPVTVRLTAEMAAHFFGRGSELAAIAPSTRRSA